MRKDGAQRNERIMRRGGCWRPRLDGLHLVNKGLQIRQMYRIQFEQKPAQTDSWGSRGGKEYR